MTSRAPPLQEPEDRGVQLEGPFESRNHMCLLCSISLWVSSLQGKSQSPPQSVASPLHPHHLQLEQAHSVCPPGCISKFQAHSRLRAFALAVLPCLELSSFSLWQHSLISKFLFKCPLLSGVFQITLWKTANGPIPHSFFSHSFYCLLASHTI